MRGPKVEDLTPPHRPEQKRISEDRRSVQIEKYSATQELPDELGEGHQAQGWFERQRIGERWGSIFPHHRLLEGDTGPLNGAFSPAVESNQRLKDPLEIHWCGCPPDANIAVKEVTAPVCKGESKLTEKTPFRRSYALSRLTGKCDSQRLTS